MAKISYDESLIQLDDVELTPKSFENVFLSEARGRVLAKDIVAKSSMPKVPTSAMDGYAVIFNDQQLETLEIDAQDNPAGDGQARTVRNGFAIKTFTGSIMPEGAEALIPIENVTVEDNFIRINETVPMGFAIRAVGESYFEGDVLIKAGTTLEYAELGVLAGLGEVMIPVVQRPRVAILATGSEVLDVGECATNDAQIISSNNYTLQALVEQHEAECVQLGVVSDAYETIKNSISDALEAADIVVTTGGVSVGDYDFVKDILPALGANVVFQGVNIKPGQHVMVAQKGNKFMVALPGFAFSSTVTFMLYVIPLIARFKGQVYAPNIVTATLDETFTKRTKKSEFTPCNVRLVNGRYHIDFEGKKAGSSALLTNMMGSTALMMTSAEDGDKQAGEDVSIMLLN